MIRTFVVHRLVLAVLFATTVALGSPPLRADREEKYFRILPLTAHTFVAEPLPHLLINCNTLIIKNADHLVLVDAHASPRVAASLIRQIRTEVSDLPVKYVILTHGHDDHAFGLRGYREEAGPGLVVIAAARTRTLLETIAARGSFFLGGFLGPKSDAYRKQDDDPARRKLGEEIAFWLEDFRQTAAHMAYPDRYLTGPMELGTGAERILLQPARGHTDGDLIVFYPAEKVIATGDLVHGYDPVEMDASFPEWLESLAALKAYDFDYLVGGHGRYLTGKSRLDLWIAFLREFQQAAHAAHAVGMSRADFVAQAQEGQLHLPHAREMYDRAQEAFALNLHPLYRQNPSFQQFLGWRAGSAYDRVQ